MISAYSSVNVREIKNLCALTFWRKTEKTNPAGRTFFQQEDSKLMPGERHSVYGQIAYTCAYLCAKTDICAS